MSRPTSATPNTKATTPRERARIALTSEIKEVARSQLAEHGASAFSLRSVARELGLGSASALYRYFPSRDALLTALIVDSYTALGAAAEAAAAAVHDGTVLTRWLAICHAIRNWALVHTHEYALIFGAPVPGYAAPPDTIAPASRVPMLLASLLQDLVAENNGEVDQFPVPPEVRRAIQPVVAEMPAEVPDHLVVRGLMAWTYLFGAVSFEVFGHRNNVITNPGYYFDYEVRQIATALGIAGKN